MKKPKESGAGFQPVEKESERTSHQEASSELPDDNLPVQPEFRTTRRRLPHWYQEGATYFVTFRLADSMPQSILDYWKREKEEWLKLNPEPHSDEQKKQLLKMMSKKRQVWLDAGHGSCVLRKTSISSIVSNALKYFDGDRYELGDFVIMPNHVHVLVTPLGERELPEILHSWKSYTANVINEKLGQTGVLWQDESYDHIVRSEAQLEFYRQYIAENPEKAKLKQDEYIHYSKD